MENDIIENLTSEDYHPVTIVERLAEHSGWTYARPDKDSMSIEITGYWKIYLITVAWSESDETLRFLCSYDFAPSESHLPRLYETINLANKRCWYGSFSFSKEDGLMYCTYGANVTGDAEVTLDQIEDIIENLLLSCDHCYLAFQLIYDKSLTPKEAMELVLEGTYGTA